ncbi:MAG: TetR/AcrR family transcriptional regulator [Bacteroidota bacterium]
MVLDIRFQVNQSLYNKDPQETELGQKILKYSIILIDQIGIESFNFKKLAQKIHSTETSIYRYFDNKHALLLFLTSWYWEWVHYLIKINMKNIEDPVRKLKVVIQNIVNATAENPLTTYINENLLHRIIIQEGSKAYHTHAVDDENEVGVFQSYKELVNTVACVIGEVNANFVYKNSLASNLFEMANNQMYFAQHLPRLTDLKNQQGDYQELQEMLEYFVFKLLK